VLLMWIYFSSAVLLFAASCARALDEAGLQVRRSRAPAHPVPQDGADVATVP